MFSPLNTWHRDTSTADGVFPLVDTTEATLRSVQKTKRGLVAGGVHPMMKEIMASLVAVLVSDLHAKNPSDTFHITVLPTESSAEEAVVESRRSSTGLVNAEVGDGDAMDVVVADVDNTAAAENGIAEAKADSTEIPESTSGDKHISLLNHTIDSLLSSITVTEGNFTPCLKSLHPFLSFGETWYEVLRAYIASKEKEASPELWDPLAACEEALLVLMDDPKSQPFRKPIDAPAEGLTDYHVIVTRPIDLGTILKRLRSGYYDSLDISTDASLSLLASADHAADDAPMQVKVSTPISGSHHSGSRHSPFSVGDKVDFYHSQASRWYESTVTEVDFDFSPPRVTLRPIRWGAGQEESVPVDSSRIAPPGHFSRDVVS